MTGSVLALESLPPMTQAVCSEHPAYDRNLLRVAGERQARVHFSSEAVPASIAIASHLPSLRGAQHGQIIMEHVANRWLIHAGVQEAKWIDAEILRSRVAGREPSLAQEIANPIEIPLT